MPSPFAALAALAWAASTSIALWSAWAWARTFFPGSGLAARAAEILTLTIGVGMALGSVAASVGLFGINAAVCVSVLVGFATSRLASGAPSARESLERLEGLGARLRGSVCASSAGRRALLAAASAPSAVYLLRSAGAPPRAWDSLTYHFFKAGQWVQYGGFVHEPAGGAWCYYVFFPPGGDLLWAWMMLPLRGDALLPLAYLGVHVWLGIAVLALCRELGAAPLESVLAVCFVWLLPAVVHYAASGYVDTIFLALVISTALFTARALQRAAPGPDLALAALAASTGALVKTTGLPMLALLGVVALGLALRRRAGVRSIAVALVLVPLLVLGPWHLWVAVHSGSPLFPYTLSIGGVTLLSGDELFARTHAAELTGATFTEADFLRLLFTHRRRGWAHLGLGGGSILVLALGALALAALLRASRNRLMAVAFPFVLALVPVLGAYSPAMAAQRWYWAPSAGRFLTPLPVALAIALAAHSSGARWPRWALGAAILLQLEPAWPVGVALDELRWAAPAALFWLAVPSLAWSARVTSHALGGARSTLIGAGTALVSFALLIPAIPNLRTARRDEYDRLAEQEIAQDVHPLDQRGDEWTAWAYLDRAEPLRIAFSTGDDVTGQRWYRYRLLGSRLQNEVVYVAPTRDGAPTPERRTASEIAASLSPSAYRARLLERTVDYVVVTAPPPPELRFLMGNPELYELAFQSPSRSVRVFRVRTE